MIAAEEGHTKVVTILLDRGADVNAANKVTYSLFIHYSLFIIHFLLLVTCYLPSAIALYFYLYDRYPYSNPHSNLKLAYRCIFNDIHPVSMQ